jgi:hypothetical protein
MDGGCGSQIWCSIPWLFWEDWDKNMKNQNHVYVRFDSFKPLEIGAVTTSLFKNLCVVSSVPRIRSTFRRLPESWVWLANAIVSGIFQEAAALYPIRVQFYNITFL